MSDVATSRFSCESCGKSYTLKPELAGRRVKCKCGHVMTVPTAPVPEPGELRLDDGLYDVAPEQPKAQAKARVPLAPVAPRVPLRPVETAAPAAVGLQAAGVAAPAAAPVASGIPLAYQKGPTQRERERMSNDTLMDMKRDVYVPVALILVGFLMYVGYYTLRYELDGAGMAMTCFGLGIMTLIKAALLIGFAFAVAGPTGVSFGGVWTAALKLATMAVLADGIATWIDAGVQKMTGGAGGFFSGVISLPVIFIAFWALLTYLFSMDGGDSWLIVALLSVFNLMIRWALILLLLSSVLNWGGISGAVIPFAGPAVSSNPMQLRVAELKEMDLLREAGEYIKGGRQMALTNVVDECYAAGCKNVWFSVARDFDGKATPTSLIVELPRFKDKSREKAARQKCYNIVKAYYDEHKFGYDKDDMTDSGDPYIFVGIR